MTELNEKTAALVRMARANDMRLKNIKERQKAAAVNADKKGEHKNERNVT